jgi:polysaccharide chain length determinant protein (PEP-CTERM system associated)
MLPGKVYTPASIVTLLWKRKWLVVLPAMVALGGAVAYSSRLPNQYRAETLILVVPQRVPESFVRSTVTMRIEDRLRTISQQILSRTRLEQIIQELNLYPEMRRQRPLDDVVAHMRDHVHITIVRGDSFRLEFTYSEPTATMRVTDRLAKDFIVDNTRERQAQAEGTSQFLGGQLEDARQRLIEQDKRLEAYRKLHAGTLPSQLPLNLQVIQNTQLQLQTLNDGISRDRDRRVVVDRTLADLANAEAIAPLPAPANPAAVIELPTERQLELARQRLSQLQARGLTSAHPDVSAAERSVKELSGKAAQERTQQPTTTNATPRTQADVARRNQVVQLTAERENLDREVAAKLADADRLRGVIAGYQARIEMVPTRESELTELTRDYDTLQTTYRSLLAKKEESQIATNLENRQIGEQFRLIDAARVPDRPVSPNRVLINAGGGVGGLLLGLALILLLEVRDSSLKTELDVVGLIDLPVLALVPVIVTADDERRRRRSRLLLLGTGTLAVLIAGVGLFVWKAGF